MDPYYSINQVDINRRPLRIDTEGVDSFNHVVCYDSEFRGGNSADTSSAGHDEDTSFLANISTQWEKHLPDISGDSRDDCFNSPSKVFKAFTETVEALALQQSVIGNSHLKPASEEEVAKVVEETRRKLKKGVTFADDRQVERATHVLEDDGSESGSTGGFVDTNVLEKRTQSATVECVQDVVVLDEEPAKRLVRIPPESLRTERQIKSKIVWNVSPKERTAGTTRNCDSELRRNILMKSFSASPESIPELSEVPKRFSSDLQNVSNLVHSEGIMNTRITEDLRQRGDFEEMELLGKYEALLRERAHLEGRLDVLQNENKELLEIRGGLERNIADLAARIQSLEMTEGHQRQEESVVRSLETQKSRLESVILDAHRLISEKDDELSAVSDELRGSRRLAEKLEEQVLKGRREVQSLEVTIKDLKSKITELYVDLQTTNQNRILSENEVQSLQGELKAALAAKEWYKEQLTACQEDKSQLQTEVTTAKSDMIRQATTIEKLKAENMRTKVNLNEIEQKLLSEKLSLARHLENIEAEMLEREALLLQSDKEYLSVRSSEESVDDRQTPENRGKHAGDSEVSETEEELESCKRELERLRTLQEAVDESLTECRKNCRSLGESIAEKEGLVESLGVEKSILVEEVEQLKLKVADRDVRISAIEQEKAVLQMDLTSTKEEKKVIDESLMALKQNLKVVEQNFHAMKADLIGKSEELEATKKLLKEKLNDLEDTEEGRLKDILNDGFKFLAPPPMGQDRPHQTTSTQTCDRRASESVGDGASQESLVRLKEEKEDCETKLLILVEQLRASQGRHKHQLNVLYGVECELEEARKEVESLKERLKASESNIAEQVLTDDSLGKSESNSSPANGTGLSQTLVLKRKSETNVDHPRVQCFVQGKCSSIKVTPTHLEGLDLKDAKLTSDDVDAIDGSDLGEVVVNRVSIVRAKNITTDGDLKNMAEMATNEKPLHRMPSECNGDCHKSLVLQKQLVELQQKLFKAEQRCISVEEQRNKVIFLEDQLDQVTQCKELEVLKHKEEMDRLSGEMASLEGEIQRLQEELLLLRFESQNSTYRDSVQEFKSALFETSKKKFYGARMFEHEEIQTTPSISAQPDVQTPTSKETSSSSSWPSQIQSTSDPREPVAAPDDNDDPKATSTREKDGWNPDVSSDPLVVQRDALRKRVQDLLSDKDSLTTSLDRLSVENQALQASLTESELSRKEEAEKHIEIKARFERQIYELNVLIQHERNVVIQNFSLELEKERGKTLELLNSQNLLKEYVTRLERSLASKESSAHQINSAFHQLKDRDSEIEDLKEKVKVLEGNVSAEQNQLKEAKKAMLLERGNNVKLKLDLEELMVQNKQLGQEVTSSNEQLSVLAGKVESLEQNNSRLTLEVEKLTSEVKVRLSEEEKLRRELGDLRVKDATLNDQIKSLDWKLSQKIVELSASEERNELVSERQLCQVNSLTETLKVKTSELQSLQSEMVTLTRERSELRARIVQFKRAITDILKQHSHASEKGRMSVNELILNKEEMERLLVDALPRSGDNKPLSFLQATLCGLRGEIDSLQTQVNEHASAVQTSSLAWKELEAQVQDLRQICRSSAASRAQSDQLMHETDQMITSSLQLPRGVSTLLSSSLSSSSSSSMMTSRSLVISTNKTSSTEVNVSSSIRCISE